MTFEFDHLLICINMEAENVDCPSRLGFRTDHRVSILGKGLPIGDSFSIMQWWNSCRFMIQRRLSGGIDR
ncbi:MAG TPA: hypothetical protein V6C78_25985 [Crinalium sp.]